MTEMSSAGGRRCPEFTMPNWRLPGDIVVNILSRLPVKSLLRFRSVSKSWLNLISNPNFISSQFNRTIAISDEACLMVRTISDPYKHGITLIRVNSTGISSAVPQIEIPFPDGHHLNILGSCNGIICLSRVPCGSEIALWNPVTRMLKDIPCPPHDSLGGGVGTVSLGLGYDAVSFDFKVVRFALKTLAVKVEMYSARAECWKYIGIDFHFISRNCGCQAIVQGNPYWVVDVKEVGDSQFCKMLAKFDATNEVLRKYPMMDLTSYDVEIREKIVDLKDSLALMVYPPGKHPNKMVDVYVLDEDSSSWSKNFSIGPMLETIFSVEQYLSNGKIMAKFSGGKYILYYPETGKIETLHVDGIVGTVNFIESLAFIEGMEQVRKEDKDVKFGKRYWYSLDT